jgi:hypothetical protein
MTDDERLAEAHRLSDRFMAALPDDPAISMMALNLTVARVMLDASDGDTDHIEGGVELFAFNLSGIIDALRSKPENITLQ